MANKVILVGHVGNDPEVKDIGNDIKVAKFSFATTERGYKTTSGTEVPEQTDWHNIVVWRGLAKVTELYVKKGSRLYLEGKIKPRSYEDKEGVKRYITEIIVDNMELMSHKKSDESGHPAPPPPPQKTPSNAGNNTTKEEPPIQEDLPF